MSFSELEPGASDQSGEHPAHTEPESNPVPLASEPSASEDPEPGRADDAAATLSAESGSPAVEEEVSSVRASAQPRALSLSDLLAAAERAAAEAERTATLGVHFTFESEEAAALVDAFHEADSVEPTLVDELAVPERGMLDAERSAVFDAAASLFTGSLFAQPSPSDAPDATGAVPAASEASAPQRRLDLFERYEHLLTAPEGSESTSHAILAAVDSSLLAPPSSVKPADAPSADDAASTDPAAASARLDLERDVDWSDDPPPAAAASEAQPAPTEKARRTRRKTSRRPSWPAFALAVAAAAALGFSGGFLSGRGSAPSLSKRLAAAQPALGESPRTAIAPAGENASAGPLASLASSSEPAAEAVSAAPHVPAPPPGRARTNSNAAPGFDSKAAQTALDRAAARAGVCVPAGEPGGNAVATVTFAKSGRVTAATLSSADFSGTYSSECIRRILSEVKVRPFSGEPVTVRKTVRVQ